MNTSYPICRLQSEASYANPLYKVFNYILYRLHTGCQWGRLPIDSAPNDSEKKSSAITQFITIFASGAAMAAWKKYGMAAL